MDTSFKDHLSEILGSKLNYVTPVSGGDINDAYSVKTRHSRYFIKCNQEPISSDMFISEARALEAIAKSGAINTPSIVCVGEYLGTAYLIMEFIEKVPIPDHESMFVFGEQLAKLHTISQESFGWVHDNYIGTLGQSNPIITSWSEFYINERLDVQITLAKNNGHLEDLSNLDLIKSFYQNIELLLKDIEPSLLHGDLWSGNFIINNEGIPYLIDPASYYGHSEVDLAMTELFGGFSSSFYEGYKNVKTIDPDYNERKALYQLYYLLVHLNLFGKSYELNCMKILNKYL